MPHDMTNKDWTKRCLILALIDAQDDSRGVLERDVQIQTKRYLRELKRLGVEHPDFYPNIVTSDYREVYDAIVYAISDGMLATNMSRERMTKLRHSTRFLMSGIYISPAHAKLAYEAARITVGKFRQHAPDDDLVENKTLAQE